MSLMMWPSSSTAFMSMPVLVEPTFTDEQTMSVSSAFGRERMSSSSAGVMDLETRRKAADQVDADLLRRRSSAWRFHEILARFAGAGADQGDRGDGDALVDDRDAVVAFDGFAGGYEVPWRTW